MWNEYFSGKTVLVSGGATGIGAAAVEGFARAGAKTVLADVADEAGRAMVEALVGDGLHVQYQHCDVTSEHDVESAFDRVLHDHGSLDVVFSNAGVEWTKDVRHTTIEEWQRVVNVNLTGMFLVCRAALRTMCEAQSGSIVVTSSPHAVATVADCGAYAASKGGVHALVRALSLEGAPFNVRVNGIVPGTIDTPMIQREAQAASNPQEQMRLMAASQPLGRLGEPREVANVALFLASPLAAFMTGSLVSVDGGLTAGLPGGPPLSYGS
jgi:dihydroanticapsin dehydrogenase